MDITLFLSMLGFALVTSITPGPNNILLMSSGALYGWRRTLPHLIGIFFGFQFMLAVSVFSAGYLLHFLPWLVPVAKVLGGLWLSWMGVQFVRAALSVSPMPSAKVEALSAKTEVPARRPFRGYEAALFQWVNPKAYILCLSVSVLYAGVSPNIAMRALLVSTGFVLAGIPSSMVWLLAGNSLKKYLSSGLRAKVFNAIMAILLFITAVIILLYSPNLPV